MTDLRTKIAAVLYRLYSHGSWEQLLEIEREAWRDDADAVIRELEAEPDNSRELLDCIGRWMKPSLWSAVDGRRNSILRILQGEIVEPPPW